MKSQANTAQPRASLKILIADDHWVVRETLKQVAQSLGEDFSTIEAASFHEALQALEENSDIGLVLVDLIMPGFNEFDGLKLLRSKFPATPFVVVSIHEDADYVLRAINHGVVGYIPKSANAQEVKTALLRIVSGEVAFPREILAGVTTGNAWKTEEAKEPQHGPIESLTEREREVLANLGVGRALSDISESMNISRQTVRVHLGNAMKKLGIPTREAVIRYSVENLDLLKRKV